MTERMLPPFSQAQYSESSAGAPVAQGQSQHIPSADFQKQALEPASELGRGTSLGHLRPVRNRRVRLITMAWGEHYIRELFSLTLPAILAPGNLPSLAAQFTCELIILTEEDWFTTLRGLAIFKQLELLCTVELRPIDDLVSYPHAYGMALTYALFRGFEDLGSSMTEVPLIFFNADFILADGSLRTVAVKLLTGERLILAPSYCVSAEKVVPWLASRRDPNIGTLAVPPREMAAVAITNRHNTIRGKTVNQRAFSVEWMDQFYWLIDEHTLIAHQMPFAVVAMQPERVVTEMRTFWDYGIISEACPTTPRCVIADSDDLLMIELRAADTARDQLRLGWPEPKQIAKKLAQFTTKDPIELARHTLFLHSGDLPPETAEAKAQLDTFVAAVLAELPPEPMPWINHPMWTYHYPTFHREREAFLARSAQPTGAGVSTTALGRRERTAVPSTSIASINGTGRRLQNRARQMYYKHFGRAPWLRPLHPRWADSQPVVNILKRFPQARMLVVTSASLPDRLFGNLDALHMSVPALGDRLGQLGVSDADWLPMNRKYDLCILELNADDLLGLIPILLRVSPRMEPGGKIIVFHINMVGADVRTQSLISNDIFWLDLPSRIHFAGSEPSLRAVNAFYEGIAGLRTRRLLPAAKGLARVSTACLAALRASKAHCIHSERAPSVFTSLTLEIDVPAKAGALIASNGHARVTA